MSEKINPLIPKDDYLLKILPEKDVKDFKSMASELQDTWRKKQMFRTETEMRVSVLDDIRHPTLASKYWQAVREQNVFFEQLIYLSFDYRKNDVKIKQLQRKIKEEKDDLKIELFNIDLEQKVFDKATMELTAKDRMRELRLWSQLKDELIKEDPNFDTENVNSHQKESLPKRLEKTWQFFDKSRDPGGAKNIASQLVTAHRLQKKGELPTPNGSFDKTITNDTNDK
tara:strand:+ start:2104 stop:2784 length:681 start_codon:yes stop_codon:yes gene_type:complete